MSSKPRPKTVKDWVRLFLFGICIGAADLVPGISGGTMALILGVYEDFIKSICTLDHKAFHSLIQMRWHQLLSLIAWQFLAALLLGMGLAIFMLAPLFHFLLNNPEYRSDFLALFAGLIISSSYYVSTKIPQWRQSHTRWLLLGMTAAGLLTLTPIYSPHIFFNLDQIMQSNSGVVLWMISCGTISVCAMLLPGISGSYVLTVLQAYPVIIGALANVSSLHFHWQSYVVLISLGLGIIIGALIFSRVIRWFLSHHRDNTLAALIGIMLGALPAVWPFWSFHFAVNPILHAKPILQPDYPILPDIYAFQFWIACGCFALGLFLVIFLESIAKKKVPLNEVFE
jgi:putative membrane protein